MEKSPLLSGTLQPPSGGYLTLKPGSCLNDWQKKNIFSTWFFVIYNSPKFKIHGSSLLNTELNCVENMVDICVAQVKSYVMCQLSSSQLPVRLPVKTLHQSTLHFPHYLSLLCCPEVKSPQNNLKTNIKWWLWYKVRIGIVEDKTHTPFFNFETLWIKIAPYFIAL